MSDMALELLILAQIVIDIVIVFVFVLVLRRFRPNHKAPSFDRITKSMNFFLEDAHKVSGQFTDQLREKQQIVKQLNEKLDKRIISLNLLLNRADLLLSTQGEKIDADKNRSISPGKEQGAILSLSKKGRNIGEIANTLSIPQEKVRLVLELKEKLAGMEDESLVMGNK